MKYNPLFNLKLRHSYYTNKKCLDFVIKPLPETETLLKNNRLLLHNNRDEISIIAPCLADDTLWIHLPNHTVFYFYLQLESETFLNFTELIDNDSSKIYHFSNVSDREIFSQELSSTVEERPQYLPKNFSNFAIVSLHLPTSFHQKWNQTAEYTIQFQASSTLWKYYLVSSDNETTYSIENTNSDITFNSTDVTDDDPISQQLTKHYGNANQHLFTSSQAIIHQEKSNFDLRLKKSSGEIIFSNLPSPSITKNGVHIISLL